MKKPSLYWICQIFGWLFYVAVNLFFFKLSYSTNFKDILNYLIWLPVGILITHLFKYIVVKLRVLKYSIYKQIPIIIITGIIQAILFFSITISIAILCGLVDYKINIVTTTTSIISLSVVFIFWSIIYFGYHIFKNYKETEIQNLKLEASSKEIELNKLKSQLNPHFMFNCMNSIRALVDENPQKAKTAITQLSNILRNTLLMHKNKFITLEDEINLVKDYLELEHIRFEERLNYSFNVNPQTHKYQIPPMIIQTLVENGLKHGIGKIAEGGSITVNASVVNNCLVIEIINSGQLGSITNSESGFGIENTTNRLKYLFGEKAKFEIKNLNNSQVISQIKIES